MDTSASFYPLRRAIFTLLLACLPLAVDAAPERWAAAIEKFAEADAVKPPPSEAVLFIGSSSIRRWTTLAQDFPGLAVLNRGFGGSELSDSLFYLDTIALPYRPRVIVVYAGENDLFRGQPPETVAATFAAFCEKIHTALPATRIVCVSIKPSPKRHYLREQIVRANTLIAAECRRDPRRAFVDVYSLMLDEQGEPRAELFANDNLHLSRKGYRLWTERLAPVLSSPDVTAGNTRAVPPTEVASGRRQS